MENCGIMFFSRKIFYFSPINNQQTITMKQPFTPKQAILKHIKVHSFEVVKSIGKEFLSIVNRNHITDTTGACYDASKDLQSFLDTYQYRQNCKFTMERNYKHLTGATDKELIEVVNGILYFLSENVTYNKTVFKYSVTEEKYRRAAEMIAQNTGLILIESLNQ
jgi:hypothetical protein